MEENGPKATDLMLQALLAAGALPDSMRVVHGAPASEDDDIVVTSPDGIAVRIQCGRDVHGPYFSADQ